MKPLGGPVGKATLLPANLLIHPHSRVYMLDSTVGSAKPAQTQAAAAAPVLHRLSSEDLT